MKNIKTMMLLLNQLEIKSLGLEIDQISLRCQSKKVPCIIYSSTMTGARLLARLDRPFFELLRRQRYTVSL